jgi:hypothetical protein
MSLNTPDYCPFKVWHILKDVSDREYKFVHDDSNQVLIKKTLK